MKSAKARVPGPAQQGESLPCPKCGKDNLLGAADLVDGLTLQCRHCPAELIVVREWNQDLGRPHWELHDAEED